MKKLYIALGVIAFGIAGLAQAEHVQATVYRLTTTGQGAKLGTVSFQDTADGLLVNENFADLSAGSHGIHVHENADCGNTTVDGKIVLGGAAGGHYDPQNTGKHTGPNADGHKGDLPVLLVQSDGTVMDSFYLHGVKAADYKKRSIIIHAGGDNYRDTPQPLGGGGDRIACGVIQ